MILKNEVSVRSRLIREDLDSTDAGMERHVVVGFVGETFRRHDICENCKVLMKEVEESTLFRVFVPDLRAT